MMERFILSQDILSPRPELKINRHRVFQTLLGGTVSLVGYILILITAGYFANILFSRREKSITYNVSPTPENSTLDIGSLPITYMTVDNFGYPIRNQSRYFTTNVMVWNLSEGDGKMTMSTVGTPIKIENCDYNKHFGIYKGYFESVPFLTDHFCIVPGQNVTLKNTFGSARGFSFFSIYLQICRNDTSINKTDCFPRSKIDKDLSGMFLNLKFLEYTFDHSNIDSPGNLYLRSDALPVGPSVYKRQVYTLKKVNYISDFGLIFQVNTNQTYYTFSENKESTDMSLISNTFQTFVYLQFSLDSKAESYFRIFMKVQTLLANIGGVIKGVIFICQIITVIFTKELYYIDLVSALFQINEKKMEQSVNNKVNIIQMNNVPPDMTLKNSFKSSNPILSQSFNFRPQDSSNKKSVTY
jgi:hypothetical protein